MAQEIKPLKDFQPHLKLSPGDIHPIVLVTGDPGRLDSIVKLCHTHQFLNCNREYKSFNCSYKGTKFTICSHGVGSAGAAIAFEELIACGAKTIIRLGTCGALQSTLSPGDIVISHSAVREEGVTPLLVPPGYPAVANPSIFQTLCEAARHLTIPYTTGICLTSDLFYPSSVLPSTLQLYAKANVQIVAMEESVLFVLGIIKNVKTGCIHVVDGCPIKDWSQTYQPGSSTVTDAKEKCIEVCLEAIIRLAHCN